MYKEINGYLMWKATHHLRASIMYKRSLTRFVEFCGEKKIEEYTVEDVVDYTNWLSSQFANETVRYSLTIIKNFFTYYRARDYVCMSPKLIMLPRKLPPNSHRAIARQEVQQMTSIISDGDFISLRDLVIIFMLWDTGVRVSELRSLNIEDINMEKRSAVIHTRKTSAARIILWSLSTHNYLLRYIHEHQKKQGIGKPNDPLFVALSRNGWHERLTTRSIQRIIKRYAQEAGITKKITPHTFRHGWAHARRDEGAPPAFIQKGLGHSSPLSSQVYQQYSDPEFEMKAQTYFPLPVIEKKEKIEALQHLALRRTDFDSIAA